MHTGSMGHIPVQRIKFGTCFTAAHRITDALPLFNQKNLMTQTCQIPCRTEPPGPAQSQCVISLCFIIPPYFLREPLRDRHEYITRNEYTCHDRSGDLNRTYRVPKRGKCPHNPRTPGIFRDFVPKFSYHKYSVCI
jgi:hypothetical protein